MTTNLNQTKNYRAVVDAARRLRSAVNSYPFRAPELRAWEREVMPAMRELDAALDEVEVEEDDDSF